MSARRIVRSAAIIASALVAVTVAATAPASASPGSGRDTVMSEATHRCLDSNGSGNAYALGCNGGTYQIWYVSPGTDLGFQDLETSLSLTVSLWGNPQSVYTSNAYGVQTTFTEKQNSDGSWTFINPIYNWCLDSNTNGNGNNVGAVYVDPCNGGAYQRFILTPA